MWAILFSLCKICNQATYVYTLLFQIFGCIARTNINICSIPQLDAYVYPASLNVAIESLSFEVAFVPQVNTLYVSSESYLFRSNNEQTQAY